MIRKFRWIGRITLLHAFACIAMAAAPSRAADAEAGRPRDVCESIARQYLNGDWDDLASTLKSRAKEIAALPPPRKADVDYVRRTVLECRPEWWAQCKAGRLVRFRPVAWGRAINATYDPGATSNLTMTYVNGAPAATLKWDAPAMDDPTIKGELEFTKGEHADVEIWTGLGTAQSWGSIPPRAQVNLSPPERKQLTWYLSFRGNIAGAYYATPRARRLALWESISGWSHEYDKEGMYMPKRALGIMLVAEVLGHPERYPSVKWPAEPPAEGAESKMVWELQEWIRRHELPLSDDRALRDAIKALATANEGKTRQTGTVTLSNGLSLALDPEADKPLNVRRDAWIKERYAKATEHP